MKKKNKIIGFIIIFLLLKNLNLIYSLNLNTSKKTLCFCVDFGIKNSLLKEQTLLDVFISQYNIEVEEGILDLNFWSQSFIEKNRIPSYSSLDGVEIQDIENLILGIGINKKFSTGTKIDFQINNLNQRSNLKYQIIDPYKKIELGISIMQPLLNGFGEINVMSKIKAERNNKVISELEFLKKIKEIKNTIKKEYILFNYSYNRFLIEKENMILINRVENSIKEKFNLGEVSKLELLKIQTKISQQKVDLINSESNYNQAEVNLKKVMGIPLDSSQWKIKYVPDDIFEIKSIVIEDLDNKYKEILIKDYKYNQLKKEIKNKEIAVKSTDNNILPELNLFLGYGIQGLSYDLSDVIKQMGTSEYYNLVLGLELKYSFENKSNLNLNRKAKLKLEESIIELKKFEIDFYSDFKNKINKMNFSTEKALTYRCLQEDSQNRLDIEKEKIQVGISSYIELLDFICEFKEIKVDLYDAIYENNIAFIELEDFMN